MTNMSDISPARALLAILSMTTQRRAAHLWVMLRDRRAEWAGTYDSVETEVRAIMDEREDFDNPDAEGAALLSALRARVEAEAEAEAEEVALPEGWGCSVYSTSAFAVYTYSRRSEDSEQFIVINRSGRVCKVGGEPAFEIVAACARDAARRAASAH